MEESHNVYFENISEKIIEKIRLSEFEILIAVAWLTNQKIINELVKLASQNVNISIIFFDDHINKKDLFKNLYYCGARIKFTKKLMHNKFCVIDRKIIVNGSYNWTNNAAGNHENITISSHNLILAKQFIEEFDKIFKTATPINSHFKNSVSEIEDLNNRFNSEYYKSSIFPYFYHIDDLKHKLKIGYYLIINKDVEQKFHKIIYFYNLNYLIADVNKVLNENLTIPKCFDGIVNIKSTNNKIIFPKYILENTIGVEKTGAYKKYIYNIDNLGNEIGNIKYEYNGKLSNDIYYRYYDPLFGGGYVQLYDNKFKLLQIDCFDAVFIDNIGIILKSIKEYKFGLYDLEGKLIVAHIYDGYKLLLSENIIEFQEFPILVCDHSKLPKGRLETYHTYLPFEEKGKETYLATYFNLKTKKYKFNQSVKKINEKKYHSYFFESDQNGQFKTLYTLVIKSNCNISLNEMTKLRDETNPYKHKEEFEKLLRTKDYQKQAEIEKIKKEQNKNCYIATLVFQDIEHPNVKFLKLYRDTTLINLYVGQKFIHYYYKYSPKVVKYLTGKKNLNLLIKFILKFIIFTLKKLKY